MKNLLLASIFVLSTAAFANEPTAATPPAGEPTAATPTEHTVTPEPTKNPGKPGKPGKHGKQAKKKNPTEKKESM